MRNNRENVLFLVCILLLACCSMAGWFGIIALIVEAVCP
jgi:hypothetical protein